LQKTYLMEIVAYEPLKSEANCASTFLSIAGYERCFFVRFPGSLYGIPCNEHNLHCIIPRSKVFLYCWLDDGLFISKLEVISE